MDHVTQVTEVQVRAVVPFVYGSSPAMRSLNKMVSEIARTDIPVFLVGETGVGKDAYAKLIHRLSRRNDSLFQKLNCASFDAARCIRQISDASHSNSATNLCGTLYLDNIEELNPPEQLSLLSSLTEREPTDSSFPNDLRFISSVTSTLNKEIELSCLRRELYFRLNGVCLRIPPLRDRTEDIPALAEQFLIKYSAALEKNAPALDERAIQVLRSHNWPGNIRELENFVRKAVLFGDVQLATNELQSLAPVASKPTTLAQASSLKLAARAASKKAERELILQVLERTHWNRKRAARELQISYKSLLYKIKQIGSFEREHEG